MKHLTQTALDKHLVHVEGVVYGTLAAVRMLGVPQCNRGALAGASYILAQLRNMSTHIATGTVTDEHRAAMMQDLWNLIHHEHAPLKLVPVDRHPGVTVSTRHQLVDAAHLGYAEDSAGNIEIDPDPLTKVTPTGDFMVQAWVRINREDLV